MKGFSYRATIPIVCCMICFACLICLFVRIYPTVTWDLIGVLAGTLSFLVAVLAVLFAFNIIEIRHSVKKQIDDRISMFEKEYLRKTVNYQYKVLDRQAQIYLSEYNSGGFYGCIAEILFQANLIDDIAKIDESVRHIEWALEFKNSASGAFFNSAGEDSAIEILKESLLPCAAKSDKAKNIFYRLSKEYNSSPQVENEEAEPNNDTNGINIL